MTSKRSRPTEEKTMASNATVGAAQQKLAPGKVTFAVRNAGKIQHDLVISGPGVKGAAKTPLLDPGKSATLTVMLAAGSYTLYCSVPGHRAAGMVAKLNVA